MAETVTMKVPAGEVVLLAGKLVARDLFALPRAVMSELGELPFAEQIGPLTRLVLSWPYAGSPADLEAWAELDVMSEMLPLWGVVKKHVYGGMVAYRKRLAN